MTDRQPTVQDVYGQIKADPAAFAALMREPDQAALIERLVQICHDAGLKDITAAEMERFIDRDPGEVLKDLNGEDRLSDEELELVAGGIRNTHVHESKKREMTRG